MSTEAIPSTDGLAAVRDGRLVITDPGPGGSPAVVSAGEGVRLVLDGQKAGDSLSVTTSSRMTVDVGSTEPTCLVEARVAPGGMEAELVVVREPGCRYALEDQEPAHELVLTRRLVERVEAPPVTAAQATAALSRAGVCHGVSHEAVQEALARADGARVVATGTPATPPTDAELTVPVLERIEADRLFTVSSGTLLARKTPARPGRDGTTVLGTPVAAPPPRDPPLEAGPGARLVETGEGILEVRAAVDGRPTVRGAVVGVEEQIALSGHVGVETGDVRVHGMLAIGGCVEEGRTVWASRDITVGGEVERATVLAGGALAVRGACMHSQLRAGGPLAVYSRALTALHDGHEQLAALAAMTRQLVEASAAAGREAPVGKVTFTVLQTRFPGLPARVRAAREVLASHDRAEIDEALLGAFEAAFRLTDGLGAHSVPSLDALERIAGALAAQARLMRTALTQPASVEVPYLQGCRVETSGPLVITGKGAFNCEIHVGGDLRCEGQGATLRGGVCHVGGDVRVNELGAPGGSKVTIELAGRTSTPDRLTAAVVHEGVHVVCNGVHIAFDARRVNLSVGVDDENRVSHASLKG
jgi:hypothetical protein